MLAAPDEVSVCTVDIDLSAGCDDRDAAGAAPGPGHGFSLDPCLCNVPSFRCSLNTIIIIITGVNEALFRQDGSIPRLMLESLEKQHICMIEAFSPKRADITPLPRCAKSEQI